MDWSCGKVCGSCGYIIVIVETVIDDSSNTEEKKGKNDPALGVHERRFFKLVFKGCEG